ncbi:hypothetical protein [Amycolatopsis sp. CA-230715]|uniref:hypothetical protein n=1 Tax=Amycolatopsis sp. CA-230715 TaxID=2745196 RepID=UPI001C03794F|nr:hypothetical protein [Amycolatopsis sp. CA-230715]QWF85763.1 hypothetical protein HUW46_09243 [Amycolatopsis sp. CA-230715]
MKRPRIGGDEQDAFSRHWRHLLHWRPGERKALKKQANKRDRKAAKRSIEEESR